MDQNLVFPELAQPASLPFPSTLVHLVSPHSFLFFRADSPTPCPSGPALARLAPFTRAEDRGEEKSPMNSKTEFPLKSQQTPH
jgi:hypothetical protein